MYRPAYPMIAIVRMAFQYGWASKKGYGISHASVTCQVLTGLTTSHNCSIGRTPGGRGRQQQHAFQANRLPTAVLLQRCNRIRRPACVFIPPLTGSDSRLHVNRLHRLHPGFSHNMHMKHRFCEAQLAIPLCYGKRNTLDGAAWKS